MLLVSHRATPSPAGQRKGFRPDIEGLRAVAILLVVAAHAGIPGLRGGFVGVDVFFVLSGYLITGLLCDEVNRTGHIALKSFYARRLQRLMPALLLMVLMTSLAAFVLLAPFEHDTQAGAAIAASTWTSNFYFAFANLDYFGPAAESNLFLHTWSLGVEEQFYLAWPLLMLFFLGRFRRVAASPDWNELWQGMLATLGICFALSLWLTYVAPPLGFYMAVSRGWQFALGAVVMLASRRAIAGALAWPWLTNRNIALSWSALAWGGMLLVVAAAVLLDSHSPYPGWRAALPSLGTAVLLAAGAHAPRNRCTALLSKRPMVAIGGVSYSWYLWHWPVLVLGGTLLDRREPLQVASLVALSLVLALLAQYLIEAPLRRSLRLRRHPGGVLAGASALAVAVAVLGVHWQREAAGWSQHPDQQQYRDVRTDVPLLYAKSCDDWFHSTRLYACYFGPEDAPNTVVLLGDSVAAQWFAAVAGHFKAPDWRVLVLTKSACPMVDESFFYARIGREYTECTIWRQRALDYVASVRPDAILLGSSPEYPFTQAQWREGTARILARLAADSPRRFLLQPVPILSFDAPVCLARQQWRERMLAIPFGTCRSTDDIAQTRDIRAWLADAARQHHTAVIDLSEAVCPQGVCLAERNGVPAFRDARHLSDRFVRSLQTDFDAALGPVQPTGALRNQPVR